MRRQIIITEYKKQILTALYEDDTLVELWLEPMTDQVRVGDIYIGKVKHIVPNIQAAFVEIRPGVMGYYSLKENTGHLFANPKKNDKVAAGDELVVQVEKENLKTKAYGLTSRFSLPGRYAVLNAGQVDIRISSKIKSEEERQRLKMIAASSGQNEPGWTIRTEASGQMAEIILEEMQQLQVDYNNIMSTYKSRTCFSKLHSGDTFYLQMVRRYLSDKECTITTDQLLISERIQKLCTSHICEAGIRLKYYEDAAYPLVKLKGIEAQIDKALQKRVWMKSGAYLVIEPTEALTVIDVNTGKAIGKQQMEENFFKINMEAAREVCRQMRLRNLSGIIIVDFINMKSAEHLQQLMHFLKNEVSKDSIQTTVVDRTALHLVEITRKKVRKTLYEQLHHVF